MTLTVEQITTPVSNEAALQLAIDILADLGFNARAWQSGGTQRSITEMAARLYAKLTIAVADVAKARFSETATGDWLTLLSESQFGNIRQSAVPTEGYVTLTASASAPGPITIDTGSFQLTFADTLNGYTYRNIESGTLNASSTLTLKIRADVAAANRDVAANTITIMKTPIAGVTVNNPVPSGSLTWITQNGADKESDAKLQARNRTKWATLSPVGTTAAFENYALTAHAAVTRVSIQVIGAGAFNVIIAGVNGSLSVDVETAVEDYIDGTTDGINRVPVGASMLVASALDHATALGGTIYILAAYNTVTAQQAIQTAIDGYFAAVPIGGVRVDPNAQGKVLFSKLMETVYRATPGVVRVDFNGFTEDFEIEASSVPYRVDTGLAFVSVV